jgi:eukaryotic-like serine/threonine-protein kinase
MLDPEPGDRIAKDLVLSRPLVQGGMGTVWVARHEGLNRDVAVKVLSGELADDDVSKARFAREAGAAMDVQSPHVVQMLDYGINEAGVPYLVMELLSGEDLESHLSRGPLPPRDVVSIVTQVGRALHRAHENNILHRDIKPANIFLVPSDGFAGEKYFVKLLDFGFAKRVNRSTAKLTEEGMVVGTPNYMSPEQMTGAKLDPRTDLFSLATVAFEAFTGRRAFPGDTLRAIADAMTRPLPQPSVLKPDLPGALDAWFARACARERDDRFANARDMVAALQQAFVADTGPLSEEAAPHARMTQSKSSPWKTVLMLLALVVVAVAVAWKLGALPQ